MAETLAQKSYDHIKKRLVGGGLAPGARLVNRSLAAEIGVSLIPVREAINRLASEGLVEYVRGAGAFVREPDRRELSDLFDLLEILEPFAAAAAARRISQGELEDLDGRSAVWWELVEEIGRNGSGIATGEQMNRWLDHLEQFHNVVIRAAQNGWLTRIAGELRVAARAFSAPRSRLAILDAQTAETLWHGHADLVDALRVGDAEEARRSTLELIRNARR